MTNKIKTAWAVGQSVRTRKGIVGVVTCVDGNILFLNCAGTVRKVAAWTVTAA